MGRPAEGRRSGDEYAVACEFAALRWFNPRQGFEPVDGVGQRHSYFPNQVSRRCDELWADERLSFQERLEALRVFVRGFCEPGELEAWIQRFRPPAHGQMPRPPGDRRGVRAWSPDEAGVSGSRRTARAREGRRTEHQERRRYRE